MTLRTSLLQVAALCAVLGACGPAPDVDAGPSDSGGDDASSATCERAADCDDATFCNGAERCAPGEPGADARGCAPGPAACATGEQCIAEESRCEACTAENEDQDGDGSASIRCGGDDCDDDDVDVFPNAVEVCDAAGRDEDCDPATWGPPGVSGGAGDQDGDGFVSAACCQQSAAGLQCGDDCDDANAERNPSAPEICNAIDDNCDGMLDPTLEDRDGDGVAGCADLPDEQRDCDETNPLTFPGAPERCDGEDNDCDGSAAGEDLDRDDFLGTDVVCEGGPLAGLPRTDCDDGDGAINEDAAELCDGVDHDCDNQSDEAPAADSCGSDAATTYACVASACVVDTCADTHDDCDMQDANGCEQALDERLHCGACGSECQFACEGRLDGCDDPVAVSAGGFHTCALTSQGRVRCWGRNDDGQLGLGSTGGSPRTVPADYVRIGGTPLTGVMEVGTGTFFGCANVAGSIVCWGRNDHGQLGTGAAGASSGMPRIVLTGATALAVGERHACAVVGGGAQCWGDSRLGETSNSVSPAAPPHTVAGGLPPPVQIVAGDHHSCALTVDGEVHCWGDNSRGQLGLGDLVGPRGDPNPVLTPNGGGVLSGYQELAAGRDMTCAYRSSSPDGMVCWGAGETRPVNMSSYFALPLGFLNSDRSGPGVFARSGISSTFVVAGAPGAELAASQLMGVGNVFGGATGFGDPDGAPTSTLCVRTRPGPIGSELELHCAANPNAHGEAGDGTQTPSGLAPVLPPL